MSKVKGSAALGFAAVAMLMFLTGCETTKHAEVMSAEELATLAQASGSQGGGAGGEQGGIPLAGQGMSEGSLSAGDGSSSSSSAGGPPLPTLRDGIAGVDYSGTGTLDASTGSGAGAPSSGTTPAGIESGTPPPSSDFSNLMTEYPAGNKSPASSFGPESPPQAYLRDGAGTFGSGSGASSGESGGAGTSGATVESGPNGYEGQQFVRALQPSDFVPEGPPQPNLGDGGASSYSGAGKGATSGSGDEEVAVPHHGEAHESMEPLNQSDLGGFQGDGSGGGHGSVALGHVYFDFDQYVIRQDAVSILQANTQLLNAKYQDSSVLIEGHCDERGTRSYNLVLGERRAQAVRDYLVDLGVPASRIQIVSYGKERPLCNEAEESCWQQNRRGHLRLQ